MRTLMDVKNAIEARKAAERELMLDIVSPTLEANAKKRWKQEVEDAKAKRRINADMARHGLEIRIL